MFSASVPVWYYLLAAYCLGSALMPLPPFPRTASRAHAYGVHAGRLVPRAVFVLAAAALLRGWAWPLAIAAALMLATLPSNARHFARGFADGRAAPPGVATAEGSPRPVVSRSDLVVGAAFVLFVRGVPAALLVAALIRIVGRST